MPFPTPLTAMLLALLCVIPTGMRGWQKVNGSTTTIPHRIRFPKAIGLNLEPTRGYRLHFLSRTVKGEIPMAKRKTIDGRGGDAFPPKSIVCARDESHRAEDFCSDIASGENLHREEK